MTGLSQEEIAKYIEDLWATYAAELAPIVDANLPAPVEASFKVFFDGLDLSGVYPIPQWVMDLYAVQDALTAAHYRQERVAHIEDTVIQILERAVASLPRIPVKMNSSPRTMTLSYEYQAFLFDFRRTFEYLAEGIVGAFGVEAPRHSRDASKALSSAAPQYQAATALMGPKLAEVAGRFRRVLSEDSPRNRLAHREPVYAGNIRIWLDPGYEPRIGLEEGAEGLPMCATPLDEPGQRLATILAAQLEELAKAIFELLMLLPQPGHGLDVERLA